MTTPQATKLKLKTRPRCTAVEGCPDRAFILSFRVRGATVRICKRHYSRFQRTAELGPAGVYHAGVAARPKRDKLMRLEFQAGFSGIDFPARIEPWGLGRVALRDMNGSRLAAQLPTNRLHGFKRRGWIVLGPWAADGTRSVRLTKAGDKLLSDGPSQGDG